MAKAKKLMTAEEFFSERAKLAYQTRRANLIAAGLLDKKTGEPARKLVLKRRRTALKAWETRRERYGENGRSV